MVTVILKLKNYYLHRNQNLKKTIEVFINIVAEIENSQILKDK